MKVRKVEDLAKEFNNTIKLLINIVEKKSRSSVEMGNLSRLKRRIYLLTAASGEEALISTACPFFIECASQIIDREEKFFLNVDVKSELLKRKGAVSAQDEFVFGLIDSVRDHYQNSSKIEQDDIYSKIKILLDDCLEYSYQK